MTLLIGIPTANEEYGFEFKYPKTLYSISEEKSSEKFKVALNLPEDLQETIGTRVEIIVTSYEQAKKEAAEHSYGKRAIGDKKLADHLYKDREPIILFVNPISADALAVFKKPAGIHLILGWWWGRQFPEGVQIEERSCIEYPNYRYYQNLPEKPWIEYFGNQKIPSISYGWGDVGYSTSYRVIFLPEYILSIVESSSGDLPEEYYHRLRGKYGADIFSRITEMNEAILNSFQLSKDVKALEIIDCSYIPVIK